MKKVFYTVVVLGLMTSSAALAQPATKTMKGYIVDNACASEHKTDLAAFVTTHPKTCILKGPCSASGYAIFADGKLEKFSSASSAQISDFLKKDDSQTAVEVSAEENNGELKLVSIKNQ